MDARNQYLKVLQERYIMAASKRERSSILDEYCRNTGQNRKYVIKRMCEFDRYSHLLYNSATIMRGGGEMKKKLLILSALGIFLIITGGCYVKTDVYEKDMSRLRDQIAVLEEEVAAGSQKIESTTADVEETKARLEELGGEISSLVETLSVSQESLEEIKAKLEEINLHVESLKGEVDLKVYIAYKELMEALLGQLKKRISSLEETAPE